LINDRWESICISAGVGVTLGRGSYFRGTDSFRGGFGGESQQL
jgi:hypothetical protein